MTAIFAAIAVWFIVLGLWISLLMPDPWDRLHD